MNVFNYWKKLLYIDKMMLMYAILENKNLTEVDERNFI